MSRGPMDHPPGHKPASVTLRPEGAEPVTAESLDPANQSLAEALGLTFRILQIVMVVLLVLFIFSGLQTIKEGESGIRLLFGRVTADDLPAGPQLGWPYPLGELVKVQTGTTTLELDEAFWPNLAPEQKRLPVQQLATIGKTSLRPGLDGSLLTGDENIAHTKWRIVYSRARPAAFARSVYTDDESRIVMAAVMRGVVQAVARVKIDDLLKQSAGDEGSVAAHAREVAQAALDRIDSGIRINQLTLVEKIPPLHLYNDFSGVQTAVQNAGQKIQRARTQARDTLNAAAGGASELVIDEIKRYEAAVELGGGAAAEGSLAVIHALLEGRPVEVEGEEYGPLVSGKATSIINEARQYKTSVVSRRRAELATFRAKLEQFKANPSVVIQRDWSEALAAFMGRENVEVYNYPSGLNVLELVLGRDPDIAREFDRLRKLAENLRAEREREQLEKSREFRTDTDASKVRQ